MDKKYLLILLLLLVPIVSAIDLRDFGTINMETNRSQLLQFQFRNYNETIPVLFFVNIPGNVLMQNKLNDFSDSLTLSNITWRTYRVNVVVFDPGTYTVTWGLNNSIDNTTINVSTFNIIVTGNSTVLIYQNDTRSRKDHYGYTGVDIVALRLANKTNNNTTKTVNITNETIVIPENNTVIPIENTTVVEQNNTFIVPQLPPVQNVTNDNTNNDTVTYDISSALIVVGIIVGIILVVIIIFGVLLFKYVLNEKEEKK